MPWYKIPSIITALYPRRTWRQATSEKTLYLTFDDGPTESITFWILDTLRQYDAKATFFCVGDNVAKYPAQYEQIISEGHTIGNHTQNHLNGWKTENTKYIRNVALCSKVVDSNLFRPPYGRMTSRQAKQLLNAGYNIVMWSFLTYDFKKGLKKERTLLKMKNKIQSGDIIVFHDHQKALESLEYLLPLVLEYFSSKGYTFKAL